MDHASHPDGLRDTSFVPTDTRTTLRRDLAAEAAVAVDKLRSAPPRLHALMPSVSQPLGANVAAALGIDVSMTGDPDGVAAMAPSSDAVLVNLGMLDSDRAAAARRVASLGVPFILDPVKVDRDPARLALARELLAAGPAIVKGNRAEMAALGKRVDLPSIAVTTGERDVVEGGGRRVEVLNGTPLLDRVIATGCATGLLVAALFGATGNAFVSGVAGVAMMGIAGERAASSAEGPGTFAARLIDALWALDGRAVTTSIRLA
ncbi:MAG: hydroxyethylthiazole kinase [Pseudomonadota bacterium]